MIRLFETPPVENGRGRLLFYGTRTHLNHKFENAKKRLRMGRVRQPLPRRPGRVQPARHRHGPFALAGRRYASGRGWIQARGRKVRPRRWQKLMRCGANSMVSGDEVSLQDRGDSAHGCAAL